MVLYLQATGQTATYFGPHTVMVEPITSTIRGAPSESVVGSEEGLKNDSAVNLDHVQTVEKSRLRRRIAEGHPEKMKAVPSTFSQ